MNNLFVPFAIVASTFFVLNFAFNYFAYAQTDFPLEITRSMLTDRNMNTYHQGFHTKITSSVPIFSTAYHSSTYPDNIPSLAQGLKSTEMSYTEPIIVAQIPQTNMKKYFVAIMRVNPDIQKDLLKIYMKYLDNDDKVLSHPNETNLGYTMLLPGEHGVQYFSLDKIRANAASLRTRGVEIISYDLEKGLSPVKDLLNPVVSVKAASDVVHKNKMKLMLSPSRDLTSLYGAQFAKIVDIYNIQAQSLQPKPTVYRSFVEQIVKELRSDNPAILISAQVSTARGSLNSMKNSISSVTDIVDGVTSWYSLDPKGLNKLERFIKWFSENYT